MFALTMLLAMAGAMEAPQEPRCQVKGCKGVGHHRCHVRQGDASPVVVQICDVHLNELQQLQLQTTTVHVPPAVEERVDGDWVAKALQAEPCPVSFDQFNKAVEGLREHGLGDPGARVLPVTSRDAREGLREMWRGVVLNAHHPPPPDRDLVIGPYAIPCSRCGAGVGIRCERGGKAAPHPERVRALHSAGQGRAG